MAKKMATEHNAECSFEEKLDQLQSLIAEIESGKDGLNEVIQKFGEGKKLASQLQGMLDGAKKVIDKNSEGLGSEESE